MARYLVVNDIHLSDRPPSSCTDSYLDDLFALLGQALFIGQSLDVQAVIWAGDVFHHKTPGRNSHATVKRLIELVRKSGLRHFVVPGNHDMLNDRIASLDESQPLGVVVASGAVELLHGWAEDGDPIYGVPWLPRFDDDSVADTLDEYCTHRRTYSNALVITHAPLYPPGQENPFEHYPVDKWAAAMDNRGAVAYGHVHEPHGTYTVDGVTFCNPGALSRGSLHEYNLTRIPSVTLWDSETGRFSLRELNAKPADQVFRLAEAQERKSAKLSAEAFLASIRDTRVQTASLEAVAEQVRGLGLTEALINLVLDLLEHAQ